MDRALEDQDLLAIELLSSISNSAANHQKHANSNDRYSSLSNADSETKGGNRTENSSNPTNLDSSMSNQSLSPAAINRSKRSKSSNSDESNSKSKAEEEEDNDEVNEDGKPVLKNTKRAAQNRAAQRAFRERKESYVRDLERKSILLDSTLDHERALLSQVASLTATISLLQSQANPPPNSPPPSSNLSHQLEKSQKENGMLRSELENKAREIVGLRAILEELRRENAVTRLEGRRY